MSEFDKIKPYLIGSVLLVLLSLVIWKVGEIVIPFVFALLLAYLMNPVVVRIQKRIKNRNVAVTFLLTGIVAIFIGFIIFLGKHLSRDAERLVHAVAVFEEEHADDIQDIKDQAYGFLSEIPESDSLQSKLEAQVDSLQNGKGSEDLSSSLSSVYSFFSSGDNDENASKNKEWSTFSMFLATLVYLIFILYTYTYFQDRHAKYFKGRNFLDGKLDGFWSDFKLVFFGYFRERLKILGINTVLILTASLILDLPGAYILAIITAIFAIPSHFHHFALPLYAISSWVASLDSGHSFFLYFGVILGVFILISILEETVYFDKILKSVNRMNPAIMILAYALWIYLFGVIVGTIIALPMMQLLLLFGGRILKNNS